MPLILMIEKCLSAKRGRYTGHPRHIFLSGDTLRKKEGEDTNEIQRAMSSIPDC